MKPKMIWANLAVNDLDRTTRFYSELGFKPNRLHISKELTSFFVGESDFVPDDLGVDGRGAGRFAEAEFQAW